MNFVAAGAGAVYDPKGSPLNYKFGTKELQETGFYDFGARMLMPDIGRWFAVDPLAEKNRKLNPYHYAANNPIRNIDPDGRMELNFTGEAAKEAFVQLRDAQTERSQKNAQRPPDDHFNANGRYMYTDKKKSNNVIVHVQNGQYLLSQLNYSSKGTAKAVSNILAYYAGKKGLSGIYGVKSISKASTLAHTTPQKSVYFNSKALSSGSLNNFYDIRSVLDHEAGARGHKSENISPYTFLAHAQVYLEQSKTADYGKSTDGNQNSVAFGFIQRLWNGYLNKEITWGGMDPYINDFNNNNTGGVTISTIGGYDGPMDVVIQNGNSQSIPEPIKIMTNPSE